MKKTRWSRPRNLSGKMYKVLCEPYQDKVGEQFAVRINGTKVELLLWFEKEKTIQQYDEQQVELIRKGYN